MWCTIKYLTIPQTTTYSIFSRFQATLTIIIITIIITTSLRQCFFFSPWHRKLPVTRKFFFCVTGVTGKILATCHGLKLLSRVKIFGSVTGNLWRVTGKKINVRSEITLKYLEKILKFWISIFCFVTGVTGRTHYSLSRVSRVTFYCCVTGM